MSGVAGDLCALNLCRINDRAVRHDLCTAPRSGQEGVPRPARQGDIPDPTVRPGRRRHSPIKAHRQHARACLVRTVAAVSARIVSNAANLAVGRWSSGPVWRRRRSRRVRVDPPLCSVCGWCPVRGRNGPDGWVAALLRGGERTRRESRERCLAARVEQFALELDSSRDATDTGAGGGRRRDDRLTSFDVLALVVAVIISAIPPPSRDSSSAVRQSAISVFSSLCANTSFPCAARRLFNIHFHTQPITGGRRQRPGLASLLPRSTTTTATASVSLERPRKRFKAGGDSDEESTVMRPVEAAANADDDVTLNSIANTSKGKTLDKDARHTVTEHENGVVFHRPWNELLQNTPYSTFNQDELTRLIIQSLDDMGYKTSSEALQTESGLNAEDEEVSVFKQAVRSGNWAQAEHLLSVFSLRENSSQTQVLFLLREQKYLECLESRDLRQALTILRAELSPLGIYTDRLHALSGFLMCNSSQELYERSGWDGGSGQSKEKLLINLQDHISAATMVPRHRLAVLISQARQYQVSQCLYHTSENRMSLFEDHKCDRNQFPSVQIALLKLHTDEVWFVKFSHSGRLLASTSKDCTVIIWNVETLEAVHTLKEHDSAVACVDWSPDDSKILSCGQDCKVKLWDTENGQCLKNYYGHNYPVSVCVWLPSGIGFITAGMDKEIMTWNTDGEILHHFTENRIYDLAVTPDGTRMIAICTGKMLHVYDLEKKTELACVHLQSNLTSIQISRDSHYVLINTSAQEIEMWNLEKFEVVRKFSGHKQEHFVIRSCFGGKDENFVLSGSEDGNVHVWHRDHGTLLEKLSGHVGTVNCVAWNPRHAHMFASAGDDFSVRIWSKTSDIN